MRTLIVSALAVGVWVIPVSHGVKQPEKRTIQRNVTTDADNAAKHNQSRRSPDAEMIDKLLTRELEIQQQNAHILQAEESHTSKQIETDERLAKYTKWLVFVGIVQGIVFFLTLLAIRHEAKIASEIASAARTNADAVGDNARALINSERPWVLVENLLLSELLPMEQQMPVQVTYEIQNYGRTPARIVRARTRFQMSNQMAEPPNPEVYEDSGGIVAQRIVPQMLTPRLGNIALLEPNRYMSADQIQAVNNGQIYLWAYGFIAYRDTLGTEGEYLTRFCYCYIVPPLIQPARFCLAGPTEYNQAT
jgi:hypothetical protein